MKKCLISLILLILLLAAPATLGSCARGELPQVNEDYADSYLYTVLSGVLYKLDTVTAVATPVCPDPLCLHNDKTCCFFGVGNSDIQFVGQYIYYMRDGRVFEYYTKLCRFDLEKGKYEVLFEPDEGSMTEMYVTGRYVFFNHVILNSEKQYEYYIYRYDMGTGRATCLSEQLQSAQSAYAADEARIFWSDISTGTYYSTSLDYDSRSDSDRTADANDGSGEYRYTLERSGFDTEYYADLLRLTRISIADGEELVIFDDIACYPVIYHGKIIYTKLGEPRFLGNAYSEDKDEYLPFYDQWGGKYYICDADGSNERVLCDFGDAGYVAQLHQNIIGSKRGVGDWVALWVQTYAPEPGGDDGRIARGNNAYLLVNIETGELKEVKIEARS